VTGEATRDIELHGNDTHGASAPVEAASEIDHDVIRVV
jgi:hypothetical protein